ncbi:MAG: DUF2924 domain-containing protein [Methylocella sp.]
MTRLRCRKQTIEKSESAPAVPNSSPSGIESLDTLDLDMLRRLWRALIGRAAPAHLSRHLLVRILPFRQQAQARGDLDRATLLARATAMGHGNAASGPAAIVTGPSQRPALRPGTLLIREHEGALHQVMVLDHGFAWNGTTFAGLSQVARAITGTHWNGPRFFGLRDKNSRREANP